MNNRSLRPRLSSFYNAHLFVTLNLLLSRVVLVDFITIAIAITIYIIYENNNYGFLFLGFGIDGTLKNGLVKGVAVLRSQ